MDAKIKSKDAIRMEKKREKDRLLVQNTDHLIEAYGCECIYSNVDYLTIKLTEGSKIVSTLRGLDDNSPNFECDNGMFKIQFEAILHSGQLTVLRMYDKKSNKIGCVHLKNEARRVIQEEVEDEDGNVIIRKMDVSKTNKNVCTNVEFTGDFWKLYAEYFDYFCDIFEIDKDDKKRVTRLDYCMDIKGIDVDEIMKELRIPIDTGDGKPGQGFYVGNHTTGWTDKSSRHEMAIYNKKLDILDKNKHKIEDNNGNRPYLEYTQADYAITRFETRMTARSLWENEASVNYCFKYCRQMACSYITRFYYIDFAKFFLESPRLDYPAREDKFMSAIVGKKALQSSQMMIAYANNLRDYTNEVKVFDTLLLNYGDRLLDWCFRKYIDKSDSKYWGSQDVISKNLLTL